MMRRRLIPGMCLALVLGVLCPALLSAGVVFEVETTYHDNSRPQVQEIQAEGKMIKMEIQAEDGSRADSEAIFRGDRREMVIVDHDSQSYMVVDGEAITAIGGQLSAAMKQVEKQLDMLPENQRDAMRKILEEQMPQAVPSAPKTEVVRTGERAEHRGYPCVRYEVRQDGKKLREVWVTDWSNVEGGDELRGVAGEMADFVSEMMDAFSSAIGSAPFAGNMFADSSPFAELRELDGFPVVTREFGDDGDTTALRSATRRTLDPADFEPPAGYKRRTMLGG